MSWKFLDGPSSRAQTICTIPDHLRNDNKNGKFSRSLISPSVDPDALLHYIDGAISCLEYSRATHCLSGSLDESSVVDLSSRCTFHSDTSMTPPSSNVEQEQTSPPLTSSAVIIGAPSRILVPDARLLDSESLKIEEKQVNGLLKDGIKIGYDARGADEAYRAACSAISEGSAELALSLLQVASVKCPPNKHAALGKVQRLTAVAMELLHKKSTALTKLSADGDNSLQTAG